VRFEAVDMNAIPAALRRGEFSMTYSAGSLEHLGGIDAGIDFFVRQMECLKPGGVAIHTTELNLSSKTSTLNSSSLCLFREQDLCRLADKLRAHGDTLLSIDIGLSDEPEDQIVDVPPWTNPIHLKLLLAGHTFTSVLLIARRG